VKVILLRGLTPTTDLYLFDLTFSLARLSDIKPLIGLIAKGGIEPP
tara:strand:- start:302 stop:439 length:138 start_codon:yes stop_codon:yes gene_type:complete